MITLKSLKEIESGTGRKWTAEFDINGNSVSKLIWVHPADSLKRGLVTKVTKAMREADRDVAYASHGIAFREHCILKSKFWEPPVDAELEQMNLDVLGEELKRIGAS